VPRPFALSFHASFLNRNLVVRRFAGTYIPVVPAVIDDDRGTPLYQQSESGQTP
jgi:hypothetical protein